MIFRSTSFFFSPLSLYGQFHRKREKEKERKGKRDCVWKFKLVVFPWWLVHPDEGGMSFPQDVGVSSPVFPVARKKVFF